MTGAVWSALALMAYTYVGFPIVLLLRAWLRPRAIRSAAVSPSIDVIIAAHNEAAAIGSKLEALLRTDYPHGSLQVIVASDGSDDHTVAIARSFGDRGVVTLDLPRVGKAGALNAALAQGSGDVVVFTDANSILPPDALPELMRPFADPEVGGVAGDQRYVIDPASADASAGERGYWAVDRWLKLAESTAGNVISATGALYAVRRSLVEAVPEGMTDDFVVSTGVIERGYRLVFASRAVAFEPPASSTSAEWGRKVRVITRGLRAVLHRRRLLDPRRHGFYAVQLLTHKVLRRVMFLPLAVLAVAAPMAWRRGRVYRLLTLGQVVAYGAGLTGLAVDAAGGRVHRLLAVPAFFILANAASFVAVVQVLTGRSVNRWSPARVTAGVEESSASIVDTAVLDGIRDALATSLLPREGVAPDASIVVPVNARGDLDNIVRLLEDLGRYRGPHRFDVVLVLNNYAADGPAPGGDELRRLGVTLLEMPTLDPPPGQVVPLTGRLRGMGAARTEWVILFDADCRIPEPTPLLDWYVERGRAGDGAAYTRVGYWGLRPGSSIRARMAVHHGARWVKRVVLRIPTTRGSNYAVQRGALERLHAEGLIADELNVGPAIKATGRRVSYNGDPSLDVLTSGRMFRGGWRRLAGYLRYRFMYNLRVLPVRAGVARRTHREHDPVDRFDYTDTDQPT